MSKRSLPYRRSNSELKGDVRKRYGSMARESGNINPIFLQKPYSTCGKVKKEPFEDLTMCIDCGWESAENCRACREERNR